MIYNSIPFHKGFHNFWWMHKFTQFYPSQLQSENRLSACESHKETMRKVNIKKNLNVLYVCDSRSMQLAGQRVWICGRRARLCCNYQTIFKIIIILCQFQVESCKETDDIWHWFQILILMTQDQSKRVLVNQLQEVPMCL